MHKTVPCADVSFFEIPSNPCGCSQCTPCHTGNSQFIDYVYEDTLFFLYKKGQTLLIAENDWKNHKENQKVNNPKDDCIKHANQPEWDQFKAVYRVLKTDSNSEII